MNFIIDGVIVLLIALFTFIGYKKGLIKVAIKILAFFVAIILAFILYKPVANIVIENTSLDENIQKSIVNKILPNSNEEKNEVKVDERIQGLIKTGATNTVNSVSETLTVKIIQIGCLLGIYIVIRLILVIVLLITSVVEKIPGIKQFNELGGAIYGFLKGLLIVWVIFAVISLTSPLMSIEFIDSLNNSILGALLYKNNLLLNIII